MNDKKEVRLIGIWYRNEEGFYTMFNQVLSSIPNDEVSYIRKNKNNGFIELMDGSLIRFVYAASSFRGCCFSESYVQDDISPEVIRTIIYPCTKLKPYEVVQLKEDDNVGEMIRNGYNKD